MLHDDSKPVTQQELDVLEKFLDQIWSKLGIDIGFSKHFIDRVNDARNKKQITIADLKKIYVETYEKLGTKIMSLGRSLNKKPGEIEAILTQLSTNLNIPFVIRWNPKKEILDFHGITIMRKPNFRPNKPGERHFKIEGQVMFNNNPKGLLEAAKAIREKSNTNAAVYDVVIREVFEVLSEKQLTSEQKEEFVEVMKFVKSLDEQIVVNELSKATLGSYIKKASKDAAQKMNSAATKSAKSIRGDGESGYKDMVKGFSRLKGVDKAVDKMEKPDKPSKAARSSDSWKGFQEETEVNEGADDKKVLNNANKISKEHPIKRAVRRLIRQKPTADV